MEHEAFHRPLLSYMAAFVEQDLDRRLELLAESVSPSAEIHGPKRVFAGYTDISEKITAFQKNWPQCRLVVSAGPVVFGSACHFPMAIVDESSAVRASGRSVVELAPDGRIQRVLAFWGEHPSLPTWWPSEFTV